MNFGNYPTLAISCLFSTYFASSVTLTAAERQSEWYVLQAKALALLVLNPATGKTVASIPLLPNVQKAVYSSQKRSMYLLHGRAFPMKGKPSQLSVVDLESRRIRPTMALGTFGTCSSKLVLSQDHSRVFCFSPGLGNRGTKVSNVEAQSGTVFAIDTASDTVTATYRMNGGRAADDFAVTETGDQVFMVSGGMRQAGAGGAIDTLTDQRTQSFKLSGGAIRDVHIDTESGRLLILTAKGAQEWDGASGRLVHQVDGLAKATQIISQ